MTMADARVTEVSLPDNPTLAQAQSFFEGDTFAYKQSDCRITEARRGHGVAEMVLDPEKHYNAQGHVMGGAIFTLADYAFAAASVCGHASSVSLSSNIEFMKSTKGTKLTATCDIDKAGHKVEFYTVEVTDDLGESIAKVTSTCYHPA